MTTYPSTSDAPRRAHPPARLRTGSGGPVPCPAARRTRVRYRGLDINLGLVRAGPDEEKAEGQERKGERGRQGELELGRGGLHAAGMAARGKNAPLASALRIDLDWAKM